MEETIDAVKDVRYKLIDIFERIEHFWASKNGLCKEAKATNDMARYDDANPHKSFAFFCRWECLKKAESKASEHEFLTRKRHGTLASRRWQKM